MKTVPRWVLVGSFTLGIAAAIALANLLGDRADDAVPRLVAETPGFTATSPAQPVDDKDVDAVAAEITRRATKSFAGLTVDPDRGSVDAYWVGAPPDDIVRFAATRPHGVTVTLHDDARFTRDQLTTAAGRLAQSSLGKRIGVASVGANADGSGLQVDLNGARPSGEAIEQVEQLTGVPGPAIRFVPYNALVLQ